MKQEASGCGGCGTFLIIILGVIMLIGMVDGLNNPPDPVCAYSVELCGSTP